MRPPLLSYGVFALCILLTGCDGGGCQNNEIIPFGAFSKKQAPDFYLPSLNHPDQLIRLSEASTEGPILLVFWATWCPSCVQEIAQLNTWHDEYTDKNFRIIAVNVAEDPETIKKFSQKYPMDYTVVLDETGDVAATYDIVALPVTVFLAKDMEILYYGFGLPVNLKQLLEVSL